MPGMQAGITDRVWDIADLFKRLGFCVPDFFAACLKILDEHRHYAAVPEHVDHSLTVDTLLFAYGHNRAIRDTHSM